MPLVQIVTRLAVVLVAGCGSAQDSPLPEAAGSEDDAVLSPSVHRAADAAESVETVSASQPPAGNRSDDADGSVDSPPDAASRKHQSTPSEGTSAAGATDQDSKTDASDRSTARAVSAPGPESWVLPRNGLRQLGVASTTLPETPELLWKFPTTDGVVAAAAIVGNDVYVAALSGNLHCLDKRTGELNWSYRSINDPNPETFAPGFKAAPTVTETAAYAGDEDGVLHAVARATGKKLWTFSTGSEIAGSVMVVGENVLLGSHDRYLYCLNRADATVVWKFETDDMINCSPAVEDGFTFVAGCDTQLRVINLERGEQTGVIPLGNQAHLVASPAVLDNMLYVGTHDGKVVGVDWKKQTTVWTYRAKGPSQQYHSSAAVAGETVVIGGRDKRVHAINRSNGELLWTFATRGRIDSSPIIVGERVFFGSADGNVYAVRLEDGREVWKYNAGADISAAPAAGEGVLVIGAESGDGAVHCFGKKDSQ